MVQCLLFVVDEQDGDATPPSSAYALLPKTFSASRRGRGVLKFLQGRQVQILDDETASRLSADISKVRILEILLDGRPSVALLPLYVAAPPRCAGLVKQLLGLTTVRTTYGSARPAVDEHNLDTLRRLVTSRPDIPLTYGKNHTGSLLHLAAELNLVDLAELLLDCGADPERRNDRTLTPLHVAVQANAFAVIQVLADRGADLNARTELSLFAPLHLSAHPAATRILLESGADVDCASYVNTTPLFQFLFPERHHEAERREILKLLLLHDAAVVMADPDGVMISALNASLDAAWITPTTEDFVCVLENRFLDPASLKQVKRLKIYRGHLSTPLILSVFARHVVKVAALHRTTELEFLLEVPWHEETTVDQFRDDCEAEIARMMSTFVSDTPVSVHDLLTSDERQLVLLLRNDSIARAVETGDLPGQFPMYGRILGYLLERGRIKRRLRDEGCKSFEFLSENFKNLLGELKEKVLDFFSKADFINLRRACLTNARRNSSSREAPGCSS